MRQFPLHPAGGRRRAATPTVTIAILDHLSSFPDPNSAEDALGGLLAIGGDLSEQRLLAAYRTGIFPWFEDDREPILWWSPDPRAVLDPAAMRVTRSLAKRLRNAGFEVSFDRAFHQVVTACGVGRRSSGETTGTWITPSMQGAYGALHESGYAHSVEVWLDGELAGGLYGLSLGTMFFGESMFSRVRDASKVALYHLCRRLRHWRFHLIDCQLPNEHLARLGAQPVPRRQFLGMLAANDESRTRRGPWHRELP